ncbi:MAG: mechanosensitive ion channel domain-containing protein [Verrucomicrobiota bacterium]
MQFFSDLSAWLLPGGRFQSSDIWQGAILLIYLLICYKWLRRLTTGVTSEKNSPAIWVQRHLVFLAFWALVVISYLALELAADIPVTIFRIFTAFGAAWILIGLATSLIRNRFIGDSTAAVAYLATLIWLFFQIDNGVEFLKNWDLGIGTFSIPVWTLVSGLTAFVFALWIGLALAKLIETQLDRVPRISPTLKVLTAKIIRIGFIVIVTFVTLSSMGIDLSALTVLSGAVGLGLGFGLQKVISNFVSGVILLLDNSIKPGDVIEIDETYGWINNLRARYASVITRDGTEHLIPNEDLITQRVINWSFTNELVRMRVPIGVSYKEDPHQCIALIIEAAKEVDRVLSTPGPVCLFKGLGDSSIDLELRFWISDPSNGVSNVKSKVLLKVWDALKANNIEIPFPQRDLHIRGSEVIPVRQANPDPD